MSARDRILSRLRARAQTPGSQTPERTPAPIPALAQPEGEALKAQFIAKAQAADAVVEECPLAEAGARIAEALRGRNLPPRLRTGSDPLLADLADHPALEVSQGPGRPDETAAACVAEAGVAETGTLALLSGPDNPVTLTFLPDQHFALVKASDLLPGFEALWARLRAQGADSRTVNLVTGPSRTADIEQTLTLGAHGPRGLHILVISDR